MSIAIAILTRSSADPRMKARLAPVLPDPDHRRDVALAFLDDLVERAAAQPGVTVKVAVTPPLEGLRMDRPSLLWHQLLLQRGATFGERLHHVLEDLANAGFHQIVMLGADVPDLPPSCLEEAVQALTSDPATVVCGPSGDGSCYLLGLTVHDHRVPDLFSPVRWSTPHMLEDTEAAAVAHGLRVHRVGEWHDVDTPEDLQTLADRLRHAPSTAPHTAAILQSLGLLQGPRALKTRPPSGVEHERTRAPTPPTSCQPSRRRRPASSVSA